jgi:hypothetical protein
VLMLPVGVAGTSRSCVGADFLAAERSDGSLLTGVSLRRRVGEVGDETGGLDVDGDIGTLVAKGRRTEFSCRSGQGQRRWGILS